jgi:hypothetical protein
LIFLTGDMHCCYHASMRIATRENIAIGLHPKYESLVVHELAGGPVNQLQLANAAEFDRVCAGRTSAGFAYESVLDRFHSEVNAVMHVKVDFVERDHLTSRKRSIVPEVEWNVIRTLTDSEAAEWPVHENRPAVAADTAASEDDASARSPESVMNGRICFVEDRKPGGLPRWSDALVRG